MSAALQLQLSALGRPVLSESGIVSLRAEDASGSFGIRPGHADLLTVLNVGVLSWTLASGQTRYCAVRRGVLMVTQGRHIDVATREALIDDQLKRLSQTVLTRFRQRDETEQERRNAHQQFELQALREMLRCLKAAPYPVSTMARTGGTA